MMALISSQQTARRLCMNRKRVPWTAFADAAYPIILAYFRSHGRSPYSSYLRENGLGWIDSAASKYYGGYHQTLRRLGFPPAPRPLLHLAGCRPHGYWASDENIRRELRAAFPELLAWGIMPSIHMIHAKLPGLAGRIVKRSSIRAVSRRLDLELYWVGMRHRRRVEGIAEVLAFYQDHGRWPHASECSSYVRSTKFVRGTSWHDFCRPRGLSYAALIRLIAIVDRHIQWLQDNRLNHKAFVRRRVLNWLIVQRVERFPLLPS